jgi:hypothetical protein
MGTLSMQKISLILEIDSFYLAYYPWVITFRVV